jgi:hypothetical protein
LWDMLSLWHVDGVSGKRIPHRKLLQGRRNTPFCRP